MHRRRPHPNPDPNRRGATLIEVMLVITIIGLIASMAIPGFQGFVVRTKSSERKIVFNAIAHVVLEEAQRNPSYVLATVLNPPAPINGSQKYWGSPAGDWKRISYAPDGRVRFHYQVTLAAGTLIIDGYSDLDGDNLASHFQQVWQQQANGSWTPLGTAPGGEYDLPSLGPGLN